MVDGDHGGVVDTGVGDHSRAGMQVLDVADVHAVGHEADHHLLHGGAGAPLLQGENLFSR